MIDRPLRILMASRFRVHPDVQSGSQFYMLQALRRHAGTVDVLDGLLPPRRLPAHLARGPDFWRAAAPALARAAFWRGLGRRDNWGRHPALCRYYARRIARQLRDGGPYDVLFADKAYHELAFLETDVPIVYSHDITFRQMLGYSREFTGLLPRAQREYADMERRATGRAAACVYAARWAADAAARDIPVPSARLRVVYCGPNFAPDMLPLDDPPHEAGPACRLLLVGRNWERKRCDLAVAVAEDLVRRGVPAHLTLVAAQPPPGRVLPPFVTVQPALSKQTTAGARVLLDLYRSATFFLLPSRAEGYGASVLEALACGLPPLTTAVGGLPEIVRDSVNGFVLDPGAPPAAYADRIADVFADPARYRALSAAARQAARDTFNWDCWGRRMADVLRAVAARRELPP